MLITYWKLLSVFFLQILGFTSLDFELLCPFGPDGFSVCGPGQQLAARKWLALEPFWSDWRENRLYSWSHLHTHL